MITELQIKQWETEKIIKEELKNPDFLNRYTRRQLRNVMLALNPRFIEQGMGSYAFRDTSKKRMYKHLIGYAILKGWLIQPCNGYVNTR